MKTYWTAILSFSRKERNGILFLFILLCLLLAVGLLADFIVPQEPVDFTSFRRDALILERASSPASDTARRVETPVSVSPGRESHDGSFLFYFDPNTASRADLLRLGIPSQVAARLINYRKAGGRFRRKEDLGKIYGFPKALLATIQPYVQIPDPVVRKNDNPAPGPAQRGAPCPVVELNTADSGALLPLDGIGPVLSSRIIRYRERLGGFHAVEQLLEVYGLDTAHYEAFRDCLRVDSSQVRKINLNEAGFNELRRLPYWSASQVRVVLNYREQHGRFADVRALFNIHALNAGTIQKVMPYLIVENQSNFYEGRNRTAAGF